jgi:hypothetical protein
MNLSHATAVVAAEVRLVEVGNHRKDRQQEEDAALQA